MRSSLSIPFAVATLLLAVATAGPVLADTSLPPLTVGTVAPDFTAYAWTGGSMHLSDYRGKIVVLDFWATWCGPCNESMPHLQEIYDKYHDDNVVVLALCSWDSGGNANDWIHAHKYTFTYALDPAGEDRDHAISRGYNVFGIPTTYIIDKNGLIAAGHVVMSEDDIADAVERLGARTADEKAHDAEVDKEIADADKDADVSTTKPVKAKKAKPKHLQDQAQKSTTS